jgi:hypothetical protein
MVMKSTSIVVPVPSSIFPILTISNMVLDDVRAGKGVVKGGTNLLGKLGHR